MSVANLNIPISEFVDLKKKLAELQAKIEFNYAKIQHINVTSFSSIPNYSNVRLISKMYLEQKSRSITLDIHGSTHKRPQRVFCFKLHSVNKISRHILLKSIQQQLNKNLNSCLNYLLGVVQDWYKSIFWIEVHERYPQTNRGQNNRRTRGPAPYKR